MTLDHRIPLGFKLRLGLSDGNHEAVNTGKTRNWTSSGRWTRVLITTSSHNLSAPRSKSGHIRDSRHRGLTGVSVAAIIASVSATVASSPLPNLLTNLMMDSVRSCRLKPHRDRLPRWRFTLRRLSPSGDCSLFWLVTLSHVCTALLDQKIRPASAKANLAFIDFLCVYACLWACTCVCVSVYLFECVCV